MANENNLIPIRSESEAREKGAKGGINSGKSRRKKRDMKQKLKMLLELPCQNYDDFNAASQLGIEMDDIDNEMVVLIGLYNEAKNGNVAAVREMRNILGKDNSHTELEIKKRELRLKEAALHKKFDTEQSKETPLLYKALGADDDDI